MAFNIKIKSLFFGLFILIILFFSFSFVFSENTEFNLDGLKNSKTESVWYQENDKNVGAASSTTGRIISEGTVKVYEWDYSLKKTSKFEWPFCILHLGRLPLNDFTSWDGIILTLKGSRPDINLSVGLNVTDSVLNSWKSLGYLIKISDKYKTYKIPFSKMKALYWWILENPKNSGKQDIDHVTDFYISTSSTSGDNSSVFITEISLFRGEGRGSVPGEIASPLNETIDLTLGNTVKSQAIIRVHPDEPFQAPYTSNKGRINPSIWGSNWGQWLNSFPDLEISKNLNLKVIRVGGNNMSRYNWHNSLITDTGSNHAKHQLPLEDFVAFCRALGAEPLIQVNAMGWAPSEKRGNPMEKCMTEKDAADLVTYLNGTKKLGVKYFEIDNEFEIWGETHRDVRKTGAPSGKDYIDIFIKYASAMKKAQAAISKPEDIKILGPVNSASWTGWKTMIYNDNFGGFDSFPPYFLRECRNYEKSSGMRILDIYSFHYYPSYRPDYNNGRQFITESLPAMLESVQTWWNPNYLNLYDYSIPRGKSWWVIPQYRKWINDIYPGTELAITEFNLDAASQIVYPSGLREIWLADLYGIMAKLWS